MASGFCDGAAIATFVRPRLQFDIVRELAPLLRNNRLRDQPLDQHCREVVFLWRSLRKMKNGIVELGDDDFRFAIPEFSKDFRKAFRSELFLR